MMAIQSNIIGKWQSIDDQKFTREFQPDFEVVDTYDGIPDTGIWTVYTGAYAPNEATFPVELDAGYIQLTFAEEEGIMKLNFKVEKLTPEELELTYMERGNILRFSRVQ
ncbi:hypothetical protein H6768_00850 [Candidatus Peribacteria bacterium]|nr:hypothetical protein [Candidatus Peribacteria bacterium]